TCVAVVLFRLAIAWTTCVGFVPFLQAFLNWVPKLFVRFMSTPADAAAGSAVNPHAWIEMARPGCPAPGAPPCDPPSVASEPRNTSDSRPGGPNRPDARDIGHLV